jgi:hypothetical protein
MNANRKAQVTLLRTSFMKRLIPQNLMRGQATLMAFATLLFLVLMTLAAYDISQMAHGKMQTMNAADAGAYAAAVVVARDANFMAYTNRAMVANHVVVGQLVSFASLAVMFEDLAGNVGALADVAAIWSPIATLVQALPKIRNQLAQVPGYMVGIVSAQNRYLGSLADLQNGMRDFTFLDAEDAVTAVIEANDKEEELKWELVSGSDALTITYGMKAFLDRFSQKNNDEDMSVAADMARKSLDSFTKSRSFGPQDSSPPEIDGDGSTFQGGSNLSSDNKTWVGLDGFKVTWLEWDEDCDPAEEDCVPKKRETPYGVGGSVAGSHNANDYSSIINMTPVTRDAAYGGRKHDLANSYSGMRPYYELNEIGEGHDKSQPFVVLVSKKIDNEGVQNANKTFRSGDDDNSYRLMEGRKKLMGVSAAETYFKRPSYEDYQNGDITASALYAKRSGYEKGVYASLFSPYWQARLTNLSAEAANVLAAMDE